MDKKTWIAVALSVLGLFAYEWYVATHYRRPPATMTKEAGPKVAPPDEVTPPPIAETKPAPQVASDVVETKVAPQTHVLETPVAKIEFTNIGGGISTVELLNHLAENGEHVVLNHFSTLPIGSIGTAGGEGGQEPYEMRTEPNAVTFERITREKIKITKRFSVEPNPSFKDEYHILLEITFANVGTEFYRMPDWFIEAGGAMPVHQNDLAMNTTYDWRAQGKMAERNATWFEPGKIPILGIPTNPRRDEFSEKSQEVTWVGVKSQFFTTLLIPADKPGRELWARQLRREVPNAHPILGIEGALGMEGFKLEPGATVRSDFTIYSGPKEFSRLKDLPHDVQSIMKYGWFQPISLFLLWMLNKLHDFFHNYAIAIVVLTLMIKSALWPLQSRATDSMKRMQVLAPKMNELKEKYKDDPTRMNQEVMKLYKEYKVNPVGGCLPMFVQIPIFFGFYAMLGSAIELRNTGFLWVNDLSQPDTVFHVMGFPINVLPLVMAGTMLWQMQLTPKAGDPAQQKIMMFMPVMFVVFCYNYASALALYWTVQNLFSIVQLYLTRNKPMPVLTKVKPDALPGKPGSGKKRPKTK